MAYILLEGFGGIRPRVSAHLLDAREATQASNCRMESGDLYGWNAASTAATTGSSGLKSIYLFGEAGGSPIWKYWTTDVDVVRSPVEGDATERTYYTGDGVPKGMNVSMAPGNQWFQLGVPAPTATALVSAPALKDVGTVTAAMTQTTAKLSVGSSQTTTFGSGGLSATDFARSADGSVTQVFTFTEFAAGTTLEVVSIVDANSFTVKDGLGGSSICSGGAFTSWRVTPYATDPGGGVGAINGELLMPNLMTVTVPGHGLRVGDILTVDAVTTPLTWTGTVGRLSASAGALTNTAVDFKPRNSGNTADVPFTVYGAWSYTVTRDESTVSSRSYVYTWVTDLGEESAPSSATATYIVASGDSVTISGFSSPPSTNRTVSKLRIYRTATGTTTTDFLFVTEQNSNVVTFVDTVKDEALGEVIQSTSWDEPPTDMFGICASPNQFLVGFSKNIICKSEPGYPHAWPVEYRDTVDYPIVGGAVTGGSVIVLTKGVPYMLTGSHPSNMAMRKLAALQACVSKRSICTIGNYVYYASPDGLVRVSSAGEVAIVTEGHITRKQWQTYSPSTMVAREHNGMYVAFYDGGTAPTRGAFIHDTRDERISFTDTTQFYSGVYTRPSTGDLYVTDGSTIYVWDGGSSASFTWKSKVFGMPYTMNLGVMRVQSANYPVTVTLYDGATGTSIAAKSVTSSQPVRLPSGKLYDTFQIAITATGTAGVQRVVVGETMEDVYAS